MEPSDRNAVAEALAAHVREALQQGEDVSVDGLGTWRVEHQPSRLRDPSAGGDGGDDRLSVTPPRDTVVFEPDRS